MSNQVGTRRGSEPPILPAAHRGNSMRGAAGGPGDILPVDPDPARVPLRVLPSLRSGTGSQGGNRPGRGQAAGAPPNRQAGKGGSNLPPPVSSTEVTYSHLRRGCGRWAGRYLAN